MAVKDQYGNYEPDMHDPMIGQTPSSKHGFGSPEGVISACPGATYVDDANGNFYVKMGGCDSTGWIQVTSGGGTPIVEVYFGTGNPNGVVSATRPAFFYTALGALWFKTGAGTNNTGWEVVLAGG